MLNEIKAYIDSGLSIKNKYTSFIADKSINLDERWELFLNAPIDWKINDPYIVHFESEKLLRREILWYDDYYFDRHETVNMTLFIELLKEKEYSDEIINSFKEEILSKNLESFDNDW